MEQDHIESFARAVAKDILMDTDFLTVVEMLDESGIAYEIDDAYQIHALVIGAKVTV